MTITVRCAAAIERVAEDQYEVTNIIGGMIGQTHRHTLEDLAQWAENAKGFDISDHTEVAQEAWRRGLNSLAERCK